MPTVSIPIGLSPDGLPLALQLVGRSGEEARLLEAAAWCEEVLNVALGHRTVLFSRPNPLVDEPVLVVSSSHDYYR